MQHSHKSSKHLVCGVSQTGKTTRLIQLLAVHPAPFVFVFDGEGELADRLQIDPVDFLNFRAESYAHRVTVCDPAQIAEDAEYLFSLFCSEVMKHGEETGQPSLIVVDEFQRYVGTHAAKIDRAVVDVVERGRRFGVDMLLATQSPQLIHTRVRNQLTEISSFRLVDTRAHLWLEPLGYIGDELRELKDGHYLWRRVGSDHATAGTIF